jgi:DNA polymerase-3 subunit gamma/tau
MAKQPPQAEPATPTAVGSYTVLARRYRPQTFTEVIGQEAVARVLANAIKGNRVAHAYLFTGPRGVGKTSTARILAKALNCENGPTETPCGVCPACRAIATGEDVDVLEIDGASNRGIEEVRSIRNNVQYSASNRSRYKIYIIDEVHMLTTAAFNALLKTLEEPPPHVKFIFATTNAQDVPATILSRCQRFDFAGIPVERIVARLREIVAEEKMEADDEGLELLARRAGGSMRDAQSLLDQLLSFGGDRLTADQVHQLLGTAGDDRIIALAEAVLTHDPRRSLDLLDQAAHGGLLLGELVEQLIAYWRDLMVLHCAGGEARDLSVSARHRDALAKQAQALPLDTILAGLDILAATRQRLEGSNHARTLVEMALVRLGRLEDLASLPQLTQLLAGGRPEAVPMRPGGGTAAVRALPPEATVKKKPLSPAGEGLADDGPVELTPANLPDVWPRVVSSVGAILGRQLEFAGIPAIFAPNSLALHFPASYNQAREHCQRPTSVARIEEVLRKATGQNWTLRIESGGGPTPAAEPERVEALPPTRTRRNPREEADNDPLIRRALNVLGAQVVRVDEGFSTGPAAANGTAVLTAVAPTEEEA